MELTPEVVFALVGSENQFPVDFDDAWQWIGYSRKSDAKEVLEASFDKGSDFCGEFRKNGLRGRPIEKIYMSVDCFKSFCMMAGTAKGREVRRYFLNCERQLKQLLEEQAKQRETDTQKRLIAAMVNQDPVSRYSKFTNEFYELMYQKRGNGWEKRDPRNRPPCVANWTNKMVYDRLLGGTNPGGVKDTLNQVNPIQENGRRKNRHHWHFNPLGEYHLDNHLAAVKAVARLSPDGDWDRFMYNIAKALPAEGEALQLSLLEYLEAIEVSSTRSS